MKTWTKGQEKALVVIQSPPREKGTATLKIDRNLWNYLPRIKRTIRIPPSMMLTSWMGSDFTNDDIVHEASFEKDYNYSLIGESKDPNGWLIELKAKPEIVGLWKKLEFVVSKDGRIPLVARYFDRKGRLARSQAVRTPKGKLANTAQPDTQMLRRSASLSSGVRNGRFIIRP